MQLFKYLSGDKTLENKYLVAERYSSCVRLYHPCCRFIEIDTELIFYNSLTAQENSFSLKTSSPSILSYLVIVPEFRVSQLKQSDT